MKHPFLLWLALLFSLLTATSHATHLKGGSLSWEPVGSTATTFTVRAKILINYDSSDTGITGATGPLVKGVRTYLVNDIVAVNVGNTDLYWGDELDPYTPSLSFEGAGSRFKVVKVDEAAQILTLEPAPVDPDDLLHTYTGAENDTFNLNIRANARDDEEVINRGGTMRLESTVKLKLAAPLSNKPPVFTFDDVDNPIVVLKSGTAKFDVPVAVDPDNAVTLTDVVRYRFITDEGEATEGDFGTPWETDNGLSIAYNASASKWEVSWDTSLIEQTVRTYTLQVVAEDVLASNPTGPAKSKSTIEFQVWVNDPDQDGVPEIALAPALTTYRAMPGTPMEFRIIGTDRYDPDEFENSRLEVVYNPAQIPANAVLIPTAGFAGEGAGHHGEGDRMESVFSWTPLPTDVGTTKVMDFKIRDEDGHESAQVTVTIQVVPVVTLQPLVLTVTPDSNIKGKPGDPLTFTVTGTCASTGVPLSIYAEDPLPGDSVMTPALPATGTSSASSTFTWTPGPADMNEPNHSYDVTFTLGDAYGREISQEVRIEVLPDEPTIALVPGTPVPVPGGTWDTLTFDVNVSGGYGGDDFLSLSTDNVGTFSQTSGSGSFSSTLTWRVLPGQVRDGILRVRVMDQWGQIKELQVQVDVAPPVAPEWWTTQGVLTGGTVEDYGMATQGQLKAIAKKAYDQLLVEDPGLATGTWYGEQLAAYITALSPTVGNYSPLTHGQLKRAAALFYDVLGEKSGFYDVGRPWTNDWSDDEMNAPASVGQVKTIFSFPLPASGLFNLPPVVSFTAPSPGSHFVPGTSFAASVTASDPDGTVTMVEFYEGSNLLATKTSPPWTASLSFTTSGNISLKAVATDNEGRRGSSAPLAVTIDPNQAPVVTMTSPSSGATFRSQQMFTLTATASDPDGSVASVQFLSGGSPVGPPDTSPPYTMNLGISTVGATDVGAVVTDNLGLQTTSAPVPVTIVPNDPPTVSIISMSGPTPYVAPASFTVFVNASDTEGIDRVVLMNGATQLGSDSSPPYVFNVTNLAAGSHSLVAVAYDIYQRSASTAPWPVTVLPTTTVTLRNGLNSYTGVQDTFIRSDTPNVASGSATTLRIDRGQPDTSALLKWDLSSIPATATVQSATLTFNVENGSTRSYEIFAAVRDWSAATATWNTSGVSAWGTAGAKATTDVESTELGALLWNTTGSKVTTLNAAGVAKIQEWISNPATNKGFAIRHYGDTNAPALIVTSSDNTANPSARPTLTITYY